MNLNQRWSDMNESQRKGLTIAIVAVIVIVLGLAGVSYLQQRGSGAPDTVTEEQKTDDAGTSGKDSGDNKDAGDSGEDGADASLTAAEPADPLDGFTRQDQTVWTTARVNFREGPKTSRKFRRSFRRKKERKTCLRH